MGDDAWERAEAIDSFRQLLADCLVIVRKRAPGLPGPIAQAEARAMAQTALRAVLAALDTAEEWPWVDDSQ